MVMRVRKNVRILLVGDRGVGKTSLILSLVSEEFPEDVPPKAEEITIPADVIPEMVPTHIVDYSASEQSDEELGEEMKRAHVICIVYSVEDEVSLASVTSHWLPLIRLSQQGRSPSPIILVGNKVDLIEDTTLESAEEIMEEYPEIESFVECSAKNLKNISEMFYYAQKAVLHPTAPVYMTDKQDLTEDCKKALSRIFRVCDLDNDGLLNDYELNAFQKRCFDMPLRPDAMEDVKAVLRRNIPGGVSPSNFITLTGFLYLHCLFIQRGRSHTTWTVLRKFGYNENLLMDKEYLFPPVKIPGGSSTELSHRGQQFFTKLFLRYDKDCDGALSPKEQDDMFYVCPARPWTSSVVNLVPTNSKGWITLQGFLCFWNLTTIYDVGTTLEYLAYFGYPISDHENQLSAIHVTRERKLDLLKKQSTRNVYICHVIGALGVGKSSICRALLGRQLQAGGGEVKGSGGDCTVNVLQVYGQEKYLVMRDVEVRSLAEPLNQDDTQCDVVCLVYDITSPKTFEYIARIYMKYFVEKSTPVLMVANKVDEPEVRQDYLVQPSVFCDAHRLPTPHLFSCTGTRPDVQQLFQKLATMAAFPHLTELNLLSGDSALWKAGFGLAILAAVGLIVSKLVNRDRR